MPFGCHTALCFERFSVNVLSFYARESKHDQVVTRIHVAIVANTCPFWVLAN